MSSRDGIHCCDEPEWTACFGLDWLVGEFADRGVESLAVVQCRRCDAYAIDVTASGRLYRVPTDVETGDAMTEASRRFWKNLRGWARS